MLYVAGDLTIDADRFALRRRGFEVRVEPRVLEFIIYLVRNRPRLVDKRELIEQVWRQNHIVDSALSRCVCLARKSVGDPSLIKTIHGRGYRWAGPEDDAPPSLREPSLAGETDAAEPSRSVVASVTKR